MAHQKGSPPDYSTVSTRQGEAIQGRQSGGRNLAERATTAPATRPDSPLADASPIAEQPGLSQNAHDLMHVLGFFYLQQNQPERALALLMIAARANPDDASVMKTLAYAFLLNHQPKRTLKIIERLESRFGPLATSAPTQIVRARALLASGQGDQARRVFRNYVDSRREIH